MSNRSFPTSAAFLFAFAGALGAQKTVVKSLIETPPMHTKVCDVQLTNVASTEPDCPVPQNVKGGIAAAVGTADIDDRRVTAEIAMKQIGSQGLVAYAEAGGLIIGKIAVVGATSPGDYLVLHFLANASWNFRGTGADAFETMILASRGEGGDDPSFVAGAGDDDGPLGHTSDHGHLTTDGADLVLPFDDFTGLYRYMYGIGLSMSIQSNIARTLGHVTLEATLTGIDAYSSADVFRGSAQFLGGGNALLVLAPTAVPEPATFFLVATGIVGLGTYRRSRRRSVR